MGRLSDLLERFFLGLQEDCMANSGTPTGRIEVVTHPLASLPKARRPCIFGGDLHCVHGANDCCFCQVRERNKARSN